MMMTLTTTTATRTATKNSDLPLGMTGAVISIDREVLGRICFSCAEEVEAAAKNIPTVVGAWTASCPECHEDGGIFMVHSDGSIAVRCPNIDGCYKRRQLLCADNYWIETDIYGRVYE